MAHTSMFGIIPLAGIIAVAGDKVALLRRMDESTGLLGEYELPIGTLHKRDDEVSAAIHALRDLTGLVVGREDLIGIPIRRRFERERDKQLQKFSLKLYVCAKFSGTLREGVEIQPEWVPVGLMESMGVPEFVRESAGEAIAYLPGNPWTDKFRMLD